MYYVLMLTPKVVAGFLIVAFVAGFFLYLMNPTPEEYKLEEVICTDDSMMCPDGSWVGRSGPNCEFVCPNKIPTEAVMKDETTD